MIQTFESFKTLEESGLNTGDKVIIKYKDSRYFMQTGIVTYIRETGTLRGDCDVQLDYNKKIVTFFYTNLSKIEELIEVPTGEIFIVMYDDDIELALAGLVRYNKQKNFYYFYEKDRWQIERYAL